jgi:2',3'-cyclic-nucleotide 2'-phosphodiesterase (5'-nucleotidase family)
MVTMKKIYKIYTKGKNIYKIYTKGKNIKKCYNNKSARYKGK